MNDVIKPEENPSIHKIELEMQNEELRESHDRLVTLQGKYQDLFDAAPVAYIITDDQGKITEINNTASHMLGLGKNDLIGTQFSRFSTSEYQDTFYLHSKQTVESNKIHSSKIDLVVNDDHVINIFIQSVIDRKTEQTTFIRSVLVDVTKQVQTEKDLADRNSNYKHIIEQASDIIYRTDLDGYFTYINPLTIRLLGHLEADIIGKHFTSGVAVDYKSKMIRFYHKQKAKQIENTYYEYLALAKDGSEIWLGQNTQLIYKNDQVVGFQSVARDISERKLVETALQESNELFRASFSDATIGMALVSNEYSIIEVNPAFCQMLGYTSESLIGISSISITHPEDIDQSVNHYQDLISGKVKSYHFEKRYIHKDGHEIYAQVIVSGVRDELGNPLYAIAQIQETTESRKAKEKARQHEIQLQALVYDISVAEENERRRIAVELHDSVIQDIALCKIKLGELSRHVITNSSLNIIAEMRLLMEQTIKESRSLVFDLSLPVLYELGFVAAIKWLAESRQEKFNIKYLVIDEGIFKPLKREVEVMLYKAVRELLINVKNHACAKEVKIFIKQTNSDVEVCVQDDGVGFRQNILESIIGNELKFGLFGIKERLGLLNGSVKVSSSPETGTKITLRAPLILDA